MHLREVGADRARRPQLGQQRAIAALVHVRDRGRRQLGEDETRRIVDARAHGEERHVRADRQRHTAQCAKSSTVTLICASAALTANANAIATFVKTTEYCITTIIASTAAGNRGQSRLAREFAQSQRGNDEREVVGSEGAVLPHLGFELVDGLSKMKSEIKITFGEKNKISTETRNNFANQRIDCSDR